MDRDQRERDRYRVRLAALEAKHCSRFEELLTQAMQLEAAVVQLDKTLACTAYSTSLEALAVGRAQARVSVLVGAVVRNAERGAMDLDVIEVAV